MAATSRPFLSGRLAGLRHDDLRRDVGARGAHRRDQPRPGLPGHRRAGRGASRPRSRRCAAGSNQYPPGPGIPELRAAIAEHQRRFYGIELDPDGEVLVTTGRDRGDRRGAARAVRARRRGRHVRAVLRLLRRLHRDGRRDAAASSRCARPTTRSTPTRSPPRSRRAPARSCSTRRTTRPARSSTRAELELIAAPLPRARRPRHHRRGLRAPGLRRPRARPARDAARHGRAHADDLLRRQDVLVHRLEDRLGDAARARSSPPSRPPSSSSPTSAARRSSPRSRTRSGCRTPTSNPSAPDLQAKRDRLCAGLEAAGLEVFRPAGHLLRHRRHPPARRGRTATRSACSCPSARASSPSRPSCSTTTRRSAARSSASRSASATR